MQPVQVRVGDLSPGNEPVPPQASAPGPPEPQDDLLPAFQRWPAREQRKHQKASQAARPRSIPGLYRCQLLPAGPEQQPTATGRSPRRFPPEDALQITKPQPARRRGGPPGWGQMKGPMSTLGAAPRQKPVCAFKQELL